MSLNICNHIITKTDPNIKDVAFISNIFDQFPDPKTIDATILVIGGGFIKPFDTIDSSKYIKLFLDWAKSLSSNTKLVIIVLGVDDSCLDGMDFTKEYRNFTADSKNARIEIANTLDKIIDVAIDALHNKTKTYSFVGLDYKENSISSVEKMVELNKHNKNIIIVSSLGTCMNVDPKKNKDRWNILLSEKKNRFTDRTNVFGTTFRIQIERFVNNINAKLLFCGGVKQEQKIFTRRIFDRNSMNEGCSIFDSSMTHNRFVFKPSSIYKGRVRMKIFDSVHIERLGFSSNYQFVGDCVKINLQ